MYIFQKWMRSLKSKSLSELIIKTGTRAPKKFINECLSTCWWTHLKGSHYEIDPLLQFQRKGPFCFTRILPASLKTIQSLCSRRANGSLRIINLYPTDKTEYCLACRKQSENTYENVFQSRYVYTKANSVYGFT